MNAGVRLSARGKEGGRGEGCLGMVGHINILAASQTDYCWTCSANWQQVGPMVCAGLGVGALSRVLTLHDMVMPLSTVWGSGPVLWPCFCCLSVMPKCELHKSG